MNNLVRQITMLASLYQPVCLAVLLGVVACHKASADLREGDANRQRPAVETPYRLRLIDQSDTVTQGLAINIRGDLVGRREYSDRIGLATIPFYLVGGIHYEPKLLPSFTNIEVEGLSDTGLVVGYTSRAPVADGGSLLAYVWSPDGEIKELSPVKGDVSSHAHDVDSAGTRITGYSIGRNPPRIRPCLWELDRSTATWTCRELPVRNPYNPFLMTSRVLISPDGQTVVACVTKSLSLVSGSLHRVVNELVAWQTWEGAWVRVPRHHHNFRLRDVNDDGVVVGTCTYERRNRACTVSADNKLTLIDLLPGDDSNEAHAVSADGTIVGFSDPPPGPDGGPTAFIASEGHVAQLPLPITTAYSAALGMSESGDVCGYLQQRDSDSPEQLKPVVAFVWSPL